MLHGDQAGHVGPVYNNKRITKFGKSVFQSLVLVLHAFATFYAFYKLIIMFTFNLNRFLE